VYEIALEPLAGFAEDLDATHSSKAELSRDGLYFDGELFVGSVTDDATVDEAPHHDEHGGNDDAVDRRHSRRGR
jgi:hypothetical protein